VTLAKYSPGGTSTSSNYIVDLKPRNELESVFKSRGKLFQHEAQLPKNDGCLT